MAFFSKFFNQDDVSALGIDIGSSAIKIVQLKKKNGQAVLETYGELALGPYAGLGVGQAVVLASDKLAQALTDLMKEKEGNITTKKCGISIPFASSLMSVIEMPDVSAKQLAVMVPLEARKYIPLPVSEVTIDWFVIPQAEAGESAFDQVEAPKPVHAKMQEILLDMPGDIIILTNSSVLCHCNDNNDFCHIKPQGKK